MNFEKSLIYLLSIWERQANTADPLLERITLIQQFYHDNREVLLILVSDMLDAEGGVRVPQLLASMDKIVNLWFGVVQHFSLSQEELEIGSD